MDAPPKSISECVRMRMAVCFIFIHFLFVSEKADVAMKLPRCQQNMFDSCVEKFDTIDCLVAVNFCESQMSGVLYPLYNLLLVDNSFSLPPRPQPIRHIKGDTTPPLHCIELISGRNA